VPPITQGHQRRIVSTQTLLAWKRFQKTQGKLATIVMQDPDGALIVAGGGLGTQWRILDKQRQELG
jgi:hypothetical protein